MIRGYTTALFVLLIINLIACADAMRNPMAVYCTRLGYSYTTEKTPAGSLGFCVLPDGKKCVAGDFVQGVCGAEYSYCTKKGYQMKVQPDGAVCVLPDGREEFAITLVKEDPTFGQYVEEKLFNKKCGNDRCEEGETADNCPQDCDMAKTTTVHLLCGNNICDADENQANCPVDCKLETTTLRSTVTPPCGNKICDAGENTQNCPQDCPKKDYTLPILIILFILIVAVIPRKQKTSKTDE